MSNYEPITLDPKKTGLVVFDLLEHAREKIETRGIVPPVMKLIDGMRALDVPIFFTRPMHRLDGLDFQKTLPEMGRDHIPYGTEKQRRAPHPAEDAGDPGTLPFKEFEVEPLDYDITKHRWSAFFGTHLDLSLKSRGIDTILIVGGTTHIGVASTVYSARDLDYQIVVCRDGCHGEEEELRVLLDYIFPQVCRVRTVDEVLASFK